MVVEGFVLNFQICVSIICQKRERENVFSCVKNVSIILLNSVSTDHFWVKVTDKLFQKLISLNGILAHPSFHLLENIPRMTKKKHSDSSPVRRQNKLWKKIMQDSSSRERNLKHPAMCTASSGAPGGGEMDANLPAVLSHCFSCQQTKLP